MRPLAIDLCAGAGGLSLAAQRAGFDRVRGDSGGARVGIHEGRMTASLARSERSRA